MARIVTGVDLGLRTAKFLRGEAKGNSFKVSRFALAQRVSEEITAGWSDLELAFKPGLARVGITGRDVNVRYTRVPRVPDWQLRNLMRFEVEEIGEQSGSGVASDFNLLPELPEIEGEDVVLLAMARESLLEEHVEGLARLGGKVQAFTPNAIALYNAFLRYGVVQDETVLLANIGHDNIDVVLLRGPDLVFARNLSGGGKLFDEAIAQRLSIPAAKAEEWKQRVGTLDPAARLADANAERIREACRAAAGQLAGLLQSTVLFAKSQIKIASLKLDRVLLCGGGATLEGLPRQLTSTMGVPVELFDPFRVVDVSALDAESAALLEAHKSEAVIALGLATMGSLDDAWSLEILPGKLARQRAFRERHSWLIAAGVLALAYLGADLYQTSQRKAEVEKRAAILQKQVKEADAIHRRTEELLAQNERLARYASELEQAAGSGLQLARSLVLLEQHLPAEFWLTQLSSDWRADPELGVPRGSERPILSLTGKAREGTNSLSSLYERFIGEVRRGLPKETRLRERLTPNGSKFTVDVCGFAPRAQAPKEGP
jgi:type IV pilus assembly protein PilM